MSHWAPKPLRPTLNQGIFKFNEEGAPVVKGLNPIQVQRQKDGSPYTTPARTALGPAQPKLTLKPEDIVSKASLASKIDNRQADAGIETDTMADMDEKVAKARSQMSSYLVSKGFKPTAF